MMLSCRDNELALLLRKRTTALDGGYGAEELFTWNTASDASAKHLKAGIAAAISCNVKHLYIAKFIPNSLEWRMILDRVSTHSHREGVVGSSTITAPC